MCDICRASYKEIAAPTRVSGARLRGASSWEGVSRASALDAVAAKLKEAGQASAFLATPQATNEDLFAFAKLADAVKGLRPGSVRSYRDTIRLLLLFVAAQKRMGTQALFPLIKKAFDSAARRVTTGELNRFIETLDWEYHMKIYYMTQASTRPPTFVVFTDKAGKLHFSAERYLINRLRERFNFEGTPIVLKSKRR
jgi:hypothetical protein